MRLEELEKKYDRKFRVVFEALKELMSEPVKGDKQIGFKVEEPSETYS